MSAIATADFPLEDWNTVKAWLAGTGDWWSAFAAIGRLILWANSRLTTAQKATCLHSCKTMKSETLAKPMLVSEMDEVEKAATAGTLDWATFFTLLIKVLSLFPFGA